MADKPGKERRRDYRPRMPSREEMAENRWLKPIAHRFLRSELWRFTRRSVPRGVMLGLFAAFIVPLGQVFLAAFLALPARANVPVAALTTFVTNPLTIPFWVYVANNVGAFVLRIDALTHGEPLQTQLNAGLGDWLMWIGREAGVTAVGFMVMAVVSAAVGYLVSGWLWQWWIAYKRSRAVRKRKTG